MTQVQVLVLVIGLVGLINVVALKTKIPGSLLLLFTGIVLGLFPDIINFQFDPNLIFNFITPPILYGAAITASVRVLRFNIYNAVVPAILQYLITAGAITWLMLIFAPSIGVGSALMLGVILSAGSDVGKVVRQIARTPRRIDEKLEVEGIVTPLVLIVFFVIVLRADLSGTFSVTDALVRIGLDLILGSFVGIALSFVFVWIRRQLPNAPVVEIVVGFGTPYFLAWVASVLTVSALPMIIVSGLALSHLYFRNPASERGVTATYRVEANGFWLAINTFLGGMMLLLIGLELPGAFRKSQSNYGWNLLFYLVAILLIIQVVRYLVPYITIKLIDSTKANPDRKANWEARIISWSGARAIVSVLVVLIIPAKTVTGAAFPGRDLLLVLTCLVIFVSMALQTVTLPWLVRHSGLGNSPDQLNQDNLVKAALAKAALAKIESYQAVDETERAVLAVLKLEYSNWLNATSPTTELADAITANSDSSTVATLPRTTSETKTETITTVKDLRRQILRAKYRALHNLRLQNLISDDVQSRYQLQLDTEAEYVMSNIFVS